MADRPSFRKAPEADGKQVSLVGRIGALARALFGGKTVGLKISRRRLGLAGRSRAPERKNGEKEMARRCRQRAKEYPHCG